MLRCPRAYAWWSATMGPETKSDPIAVIAAMLY